MYILLWDILRLVNTNGKMFELFPQQTAELHILSSCELKHPKHLYVQSDFTPEHSDTCTELFPIAIAVVTCIVLVVTKATRVID